jgi:hypothetical protein
MPEKALKKDVFAASLLVRDVPDPVLKLLGDLPRMPSVLSFSPLGHYTETKGIGVPTIIV